MLNCTGLVISFNDIKFIVQLKACQHASVYKHQLFKHTKCYIYHISVSNALRYYRAFNKWVLSQGKFNQDMYE